MEICKCRILWRNVSNNIFCPINPNLLMEKLSHVNKTGDIKSIVITEESGIAKGIRRIIAVTGHEAAEVTRVADSLKTRLEALERTPTDAELRQLSVELDKADISVLRKAELKDKFIKVRKAFDDKTKAKTNAASKSVSQQHHEGNFY